MMESGLRDMAIFYCPECCYQMLSFRGLKLSLTLPLAEREAGGVYGCSDLSLPGVALRPAGRVLRCPIAEDVELLSTC